MLEIIMQYGSEASCETHLSQRRWLGSKYRSDVFCAVNHIQKLQNELWITNIFQNIIKDVAIAIYQQVVVTHDEKKMVTFTPTHEISLPNFGPKT